VTGAVEHRPRARRIPELATGEIEVRAAGLEILNRSKTPPFTASQPELPGEDMRLNTATSISAGRRCRRRCCFGADHQDDAGLLREHQFIDVETPILGRSTPEGARDYLVPSRVHSGKFYALPQSPQLYKQILMVAATTATFKSPAASATKTCARTAARVHAVDLEMSFVRRQRHHRHIDGLVARLARELLGLEVALPLPRMTYDEAMERFGHDAPDLRLAWS